MNNPKHTKGPWIIDKDTTTPNHETSIRAEGDIGQLLQVCKINEYVDLKTGGANARLIAAAPELLSLLERVIKANGVNHIPELKRECLEAIAKATGGSNE